MALCIGSESVPEFVGLAHKMKRSATCVQAHPRNCIGFRCSYYHQHLKENGLSAKCEMRTETLSVNGQL